MPRYREPFTLFPRKLRSGKKIYYYRTYLPDGTRSVAHSTGETNRTLARGYCARLLAEGLLCTGSGMRFGAYATSFFSGDSRWLRDKLQEGNGSARPVAENTLKTYRNCNSKFILPYFSRYRLCDITPAHIRSFRNSMIERGCSNSAINLSCVCLKIIFSYALADNLIQRSPFTSVRQMYVNARARGTLSEEELCRIFRNWSGSKERKYFCIIAAATGMRISEICAIRSSTLHRDYIDIRDQLLDGKLSPVKDGERRKLRICGEAYELLAGLIRRDGELAFKSNQSAYRLSFYGNLGYSDSERRDKGITFHSLRHFANTYLLSNGVSEIKVRSVLGHSSGKGSMTERYANFEPSDFDEVAKLQGRLIRLFLSVELSNQ